MAMMLGEAQGRITLDVSDVMANSKAAQGALTNLDGAAGRAGGGFERFKNTMLGVGTALIAPMALGLKHAVDLEQQMANVNAALGGVDTSQLEQLQHLFEDIGASSQYSAVEVGAVGEALVKAGFDIESVMNGAVQSVVDLSQATGDGLDPALTAVISTMNTWSEAVVGVDLAVTDAARVADVMTVAANESSAGIADINAGMRSLGPVAAQLGIPFEDAAAAIALFTNNGLKGADAGISIARGLTNLADPTSEAATLMNELGIAAFDMEGNFVGMPSLFRQLQEGLGDLDQQTQLAALSTIFGAEAMDVMGLAILNGADPLEALIELMGESGQAAEQSALRMDTLGAQWGELTEGVSTLLGSLVQGLIPGMRMVVDAANAMVDVFMRIPGPIKTVIGAVAGLLAGIAAVVRAMQAFSAINMILGAAGGGAAGFGLGALAAPLLAIAAVVGVAAAAIKFDLGGIGTAVERFIDVWNNLADSAANNAFSRALIALGQALQTFDIGWLDDLGRGLNDVGRGLNAFFEGFWGDQSEEGIKNIEKARDMTGLLIDQIEDAAGADGFRYLLMETNVDTGELEEVGEILESHDDPNDASRWWARIKVDGEEYEAWIDKETGDITQIPVEVEIDSKSEKKTRKTIDKIIDGLEGMDKVLKNSRFPILGELSGFALDAARSIDSLQEHFGYFRRLGLDPVEAGLQSIGHVFPRFADEARALQVRWINLTDSFRQFRAQGLNPVEAGILALGQAFPSLQTAMTGLYGVVDGLGDAFGAAIQGDWSAAFDGLAQAARSAGVVIGEIAGAVADLAVDLFNWTINVGAPRVIGWLADHAGDIWAGLQAAVGWVWDGLVELGGWVLNTAVPAVTGWVADNAGSIWNALSTAAGWVWDGLVELGSWVITTAAPQVVGWMASASGNIWNALATAAGWAWSGVVEMPNWVLNTVAPTVAGWLTGIGEWLRTKIVEGLASFGITSTDLITVGTSIASALGEAVTLGLQSVADFGATVLTWLTEQMQGIDWNSLGNTIGTKLGEAIKLGIQGLAALIGLGAFLLAELLLAIVDVDWSSLGSSIKAFLETALEAGFDFATGFIQGLFDGLFDGISFDTITAKGAELIQSFTNGFEIAWPATQAWLADLGNKSLTAVGVMIDVLLGQGAALIQGFVNGFDLALPLVTAWLADLGNKAVAALPDLGDKLKQKGRDLIQGFWDGAKEVWDDFIGWLNGRDDDMDTISGEGEGGGGGAGASTLFGDWGPSVAGMMEQIRAAADTGMETVRSTIQAKGVEWGTAMSTAIAALNSGGPAGLGAAVGGGAAGLLSGLAASVSAGMDAVTTTITTKSAEWGMAMGTAIANLNAGSAFGGGAAPGGVAAGGMAAGGALSGLQMSISTAMDGVTSTITAKGAEWIPPMQAAGVAAGTAAGTGLGQGLQTGTIAVTTHANAWPVIVESVSGSMQGAGSTAGAAASAGVADGMQIGTTAVTTHAGAWPEIVASFEGAMSDAGSTIGAAAGEGVAAGLESMLDRVSAAASAIVAEVERAMAAGLRVQSPSKVTQYIGQMVGMGLVGGMLSTIPQVSSAAGGLATAAVPSPYLPNTPATYGGGTVINQGSHTVHATINAQNGLSESDYLHIAERLGNAIREGVDIVYTSHGATT